jgi:hypothetical protein
MSVISLPCGGWVEVERVRGIEPPYSAWKAAALPLSYTRVSALVWAWWAEKDSNLRRREPADLQSAPFGRFGICPSGVRLSVKELGATRRDRTGDLQFTKLLLYQLSYGGRMPPVHPGRWGSALLVMASGVSSLAGGGSAPRSSAPGATVRGPGSGGASDSLANRPDRQRPCQPSYPLGPEPRTQRPTPQRTPFSWPMAGSTPTRGLRYGTSFSAITSLPAALSSSRGMGLVSLATVGRGVVKHSTR